MAIEDVERIDTHAHVVPPFWKEYCQETGYGQADGIAEIPVESPIILENQLKADVGPGMECGGPSGFDETSQGQEINP